MTPGMDRPRLAALDGVRALAVVAVLLFHGGVGWLGGGFLGVDVFFVLSGYLITGLLLVEWRRTGRLRLGAFWARRARRLLPALVVVVAVVAAVSRFLLPRDELALLRGDALAALGYVANWQMILRGTDYFAQTASPSPLQHTWSLGIEEQFYLLWPLVVLALLRWTPTRHRRVALLGVVGLGVITSVAVGWLLSGPDADLDRAYFGSDSRAVSILLGCGLAVALSEHPVVSPRGRRVCGVAALAGALVIGWMCVHADGADPRFYRGGLLVTALAAVAVLADAVLVPDSLTARLLSVPPLPVLGRISYGVYLWHWPIFTWLDAERTGLSGSGLLAVRCAVTLLVAGASFVLIERPILAGRRWQLQPRRTLAAAGTALVVTGCSVLVPLDTGQPPVSQLVDNPRDDDTSALPALPAGPSTPAGPHHHTPGLPVRVDTFGDSMARTLMKNLPPRPDLIVDDRTMLGCGIALGGPFRYFGSVQQQPAGCAQWPTLIEQATAADDPDVALILVGRWETMDRVHDGRWTHIGDPSFDDYLRGQLERAVNLATARGAVAALCTQPYNKRGERPDGGLWPEDEPERVNRWNLLVRQVAAAHPHDVHLVDLAARVSPAGHFTYAVDGVQVRSDGVHFTAAGVRWLAPWLVPQLVTAAR